MGIFVDLPIKNGDFPVRYVKLPEGKMVGSSGIERWSTSFKKRFKTQQETHGKL